jgi:hypothetical protein
MRRRNWKVDSKIQRLKDSKIQRLKNSKIQRFKDSKIQRFKDSKIQRLKDSKIQRLKDSKIQRFTQLKQGVRRRSLLLQMFCFIEVCYCSGKGIDFICSSFE